ncbi:MAG: hypothetical protein A2511_03010 [Deltaproteobacteria bacterium RIFOXYD12_FULL_50_9]|nr:MAG: hypothetical protein A2511_03010 [Deltaproteobacteria bacterium RIFOXYD12_FULL_50_9]
MVIADQHTGNNGMLLNRIVLGNWLLLLIMTLCAWFSFSALTARSIFLGGAIVNISFMLLKRDLTGLLSNGLVAVKARFFIKYYARLMVLALLLYVLIRYQVVNNVGLLVGLSTVLLGVLFSVAGEARKILFQAKEAL